MREDSFVIEGGRKLCGEIDIQGSKNSVLPILAATVLAEKKCIIHNCPNLSDVDSAIAILRHLGCSVIRYENSVEVDASCISRFDIPKKLMREMRSSVIFLGAVLGRMKKANMTYPGGCELGPRPIDLHIGAFRALGADISEEYGHIVCTTEGAVGKEINLSFPSVGATENIMLFCTRSKGITKIVNAAREPEIEDLQMFLNKIGARISGAGTDIITVEGVETLSGCEHTVIPDRIAAATYMCAAAITGGEIRINGADLSHMGSVASVLRESGCEIVQNKEGIKLAAPKKIAPVKVIRTMPYPGFPTDAQAIVMAYLTRSYGVSTFVETIFENRYRHTDDLISMGADITVTGKTCVVRGVNNLMGANMRATDLRGGAALVVAALSADGVSVVEDISHIERGYDDFDVNLMKLGAQIKRQKI